MPLAAMMANPISATAMAKIMKRRVLRRMLSVAVMVFPCVAVIVRSGRFAAGPHTTQTRDQRHTIDEQRDRGEAVGRDDKPPTAGDGSAHSLRSFARRSLPLVDRFACRFS